MVTLVVLGFALVSLPLLVAVIGGAIYVDRLTTRGEQLVRDGVALTREGQTLRTDLLRMERNARQYRIVGRGELIELYSERHLELMEALEALDSQAFAPGAAAQRAELREVAAGVADVIRQAPPDSEALVAALERFGTMHALAREITSATDRAIDTELATLEARSAQARTFLYWQVAGLIPVTLVLAAFFTWLILRPIGRLGRAIRSLGALEPPPAISVGGPPAIRALGEELERLRGRLARSEAEKNQFLRHMSHELKTPLAAIREGTDLLAEGAISADSRNYHDVLDILRRSGVELQELVENLLTLSARDLSQAPEPIALPELVDEALDRHSLALTRSGVQVHRDVQSATFPGFRPLMQSALSNLIGNAIRFSPPGATLYVRARRRGTRAVLEVADEGPGIPVEERPHVFEPFFQGALRPDARIRGTGVGLSVVRDCARAHDGRVEIVDGEFIGAHFRLTVQARRRENAEKRLEEA
ncbi:MAG: ATP-binding protein [Halofilum sp. (in: g-proteobacteria)]